MNSVKLLSKFVHHVIKFIIFIQFFEGAVLWWETISSHSLNNAKSFNEWGVYTKLCKE
jgi:hypothetical protein